MKTCGKCKVEKPLDEFYPRSDQAGGTRSDCKDCTNLLRKQRYAANSEKELKKNREWALANAERLRATNLEWAHKNPITIKEKHLRRYAKDTAKEIARVRRWQSNNRQKVNAISAKCRAQDAVPAWADEEKIALFYEEASFATEFFGIPFHVDHIVPLSGMNGRQKIVCGLHWEGNLQVLKATENMQKNSSWWPDMPTK